MGTGPDKNDWNDAPENTHVDLGADLLEEKTQPLLYPPASKTGKFDVDDAYKGVLILISEGFQEEAKRALREILRHDAKFVAARKKLDEIHRLELEQIFSNQKLAKPETEFAENPGSVVARLDQELDLGLSTQNQLSLFQDAELLEAFEETLMREMETVDDRSRLDIGVGFLEMGLYTLALQNFEQAEKQALQKSDPDPVLALSATALKAYSMILSGQAFAARQEIEPHLQDSELNTEQKLEFLYLMGRAYEVEGNSRGAKIWYDRVTQIDRYYRDSYERLANLG